MCNKLCHRTYKQNVPANSENISNLFTHLCNRHAHFHVLITSLLSQAMIERKLCTIVSVLMCHTKTFYY